MKVLEINNLKSLNKNISNNFKNNIDNKWINENIDIIKKSFDIRTNKYNEFTYYNIYLLFITILKNLFDNNLFTRKETQINKIKYMYYILNEEILLEHINIMNIFNNNLIIFN